MKKRLGLVLSCLLVAPAFAEDFPQFTLAWSEYPSWSTFGVAGNADVALINGKAGELGEIEAKYGVDLVTKLADYDTCMIMYGSNEADFVCITNMDILSPSLKRSSVAILPTSTSNGADALIVSGGITSLDQLQGKRVYGLSKSVSEFMFARNLELQGKNPADFTFKNMDPGAAALAMQQGDDNIAAIAVWNPYLLETLNKRKDARVLFDSTTMPNEIIDMVVGGRDALDRPGGEAAAKAICETFYRVSRRMNDPATRDDTLIALGEKFANLTVQHMRQVVRQTRFYSTPNQGLDIFTSQDLQGTMGRVTSFCSKSGMLDKAPSIAFGKGQANLLFDPSYMKAVSGH